MKKVLVVLLLSFTNILFGQYILPNNATWEENQVVVRFSDNLIMALNSQSRTEIAVIDRILDKYKIVEGERVYKNYKPLPIGAKGFTTYSGKYYEYPRLDNIYLFHSDSGLEGYEIVNMINELNSLGQKYVKYAEPNYHFKVGSITPQDPLYTYQYNASAMNVDSVWHLMQDSLKTDQDFVIAIIDTGVDTTHQDLQGKRFTNYIEANGLPGVDDDANGYIDDISGWDFVNLDNAPLDDNSHGTHCAAIAVGRHDSIGVAGIGLKAKYMAVKGLESSGWSNSTTLGQAIVYAASNGADILSMSFGGYGRSLAQENGLAYAYAFSIPVGAAGNDGICIRNDGKYCPEGVPPAPMYPGAYTFVLGVQASQQNFGWQGYRSFFTNYDFDGPCYTDYADDFNYEVWAPGASIISAIPNNQYATWNGTSMATPAVAGSIALYKAFHPNYTNERIFVDYIMSWYDASGIYSKGQGFPYNSIDVVKAIYPEERPVLWAEKLTIVDSLWGDGDATLDAGELVQVQVDMKNVGHYTDSAYVGIRMSLYEDKTIIDFIDSTYFLGSMSSYSVVSNNVGLFKLRVDSSVVNGRNINFNIYSWTPNGDTTSQDIWVEAQNGCEFNGIYPGKTIWTPDCGIIVTGNSFFDTLIIKPGTYVQMDGQVGIAFNHLVCQGNRDSTILFTKNINSYELWSGLTSFRDDAIIKYTIFEYGWPRTSQSLVGPSNKISFEDCVFRYNEHYYGWTYTGNHLTLSGNSYAERCVFEYNSAQSHIVGLEDDNWTGYFKDNIFSGNLTQNGILPLAGISIRTVNDLSRIKNNSILRHRQYLWAVPNHDPNGFPIGVRWSNGGGNVLPTFQINYLDSNYYGATNSQYIETLIHDFTENAIYPVVNGANKKLTTPSRNAHGHVHDIQLNGQSINIYNNPIHQDIGLGRHVVTVKFNRPMDVDETPFTCFGVRQPFTQNILNDSSYWSSDSTSWTTYMNITQTIVSDGYNKISVRNIKDDEGFDLPIEDYRFEFRLNIAGSLSSGFSALGDTSSIKLFWERPDSIFDLIGYNLYRVDTTADLNGDGIFGDTLLVNNTMLLDTAFIDEDVIGGNFYKYFYTSLRSNFSESQYSFPAWATPFASKPRVRTAKAVESSGSNGQVTFNSGIDPNFIQTEGRFQFGTSKSNLSNSTQWEYVGSTYYELPYSKAVQSLLPGTVYYYRAQGKNNLGLKSGAIDSLLTRSSPSVSIIGDTVFCNSDSVSVQAFINSLDTTLVSVINWGDGSFSNGAQAKHLYSTPGLKTITINITGEYTVTKSVLHTVEVLQSNLIATPTVTGLTNFCVGQTATISLPTGNSAYMWNTGDTTNEIVVSTSGQYFATYVNSFGCTVQSSPVNIVVNTLPTAAITSANSATSFCTGGSLTLSAPAGMTGYQWKLNGTTISGATSASYSAAAAGSYTVLITNASGCTSLSAGFTVTENALPTAAVSALSSTTFCQGDSVVLSAPAGYTYLWSNGATTQSITASTAGTYSVAVTNASGCSVTSSPVTVTVNYIPTMSVTNMGALSFCTGGSTTLTAAGGFASYLWSNGATTQSIIVNAAGTYSVTGYTAAGCTSQSSATSVVVSALPVATVSASGSTTFCLGDSVVLSAPAGYTYLWSTGATTQSISAKDAGVYSVTVTDGSGCSATSASTTVSVNVPTRPGLTAGSATTFCQGASVVLSMPSGYSNRMWNTGATSQSIVATTSGIYYVTAQTSNGCQVVSDTITVTVNDLPVATATTSDPTTFCVGGAATLHAPAGMTTYQWYKDGIAVVGATDSTYAATVSGSYRVQVANASGCGQLSAAQVITVNALPVASVSATGTTTFCQGDSVVLSAPAGYTYLWSTGATTQSISAKTSGAYSVTVTNANGCSASSAATTVSVNSIVTPSITANGATSFCQGGSVVLSAPSGYSSYLWSTGQSSQSITVSSAGSYSVTVTNAAGCTSQSSATSVVVSALPVASVSASGSTTFCLGDSVVLSAPAGYTYLWSTGATTQSITVTSSGSYQVTVTNANGCFTTSASTAVQVSTISTPNITANGATNFCQGGSVVLSAPSGYSYLWSNGSTGSSITVTSAGSYTVTVTNAAGCSATSASVAVTIDPLPSVTATAQGATTFCPGDSVMLMANPGLSNYTWSNGQTGPSIWVYQAGTYTVEAENANGCVGQSNAIQVTVSPVPATPTVYYSNNANLLISSAPTGNQWYLNGVAIPGADSTTWYPTQNGIYSVIVTNAAGCSSESAQFNYVNIGTDEWLRAQIKLYPNPNDGKFQIAYPAEMEFETVRVLDGVGRILYEGKAETNHVELDLSKEASGLYRVELMGAKGFIYLPVTIQ